MGTVEKASRASRTLVFITQPLLFLAGAALFFTHPEDSERFLGAILCISALTLIVLAWLQKRPPTRRS
jgi:hypothetical protein